MVRLGSEGLDGAVLGTITTRYAGRFINLVAIGLREPHAESPCGPPYLQSFRGLPHPWQLKGRRIRLHPKE